MTTVEWDGEAVIVVGEVDIGTCHLLCDAITKYATDRIVVDMADCSFCDSSCLRCLINPLENGVAVVVVVRNASRVVLRVLEISGVMGLLTLE